MTGADRERALEEAMSAHREVHRSSGAIRACPAWHDLSEDDRQILYEETISLRKMEAALDPDGLSTTAHAVLDRIRAGGSSR
jgi:hypothetical protein